jgi:hypothetical protein
MPLVLGFACFALSPDVRAVCQQGCDTSNANTFLGDDALVNNTTGSANTAVGAAALLLNTTGEHNTAVGIDALQNNTIGGDNTATGFDALENNTIGVNNTANGSTALALNTTGSANTASGFDALFSNTSGGGNTATGALALVNNTMGGENTAVGGDALLSNTTGSNNTALGFDALFYNRRGNNNTAIGVDALYSNTRGINNIAVGDSAGANLTTGNDNIDIGNAGVAGEAKTIRIGTTGTQTNAYIAGISGATVPTGVAVIVDTSGHLGTTTSSARFKEDIKPMENASEAILALKPVIFRYKHELDHEGIPQFGLVAEQVEKVNPDLVARDEQGKPYTVRYEAVNAMLLNEFLKEHRKNEEQQAIIERQQKQIDALAAGLQKVSAQLATGRVRPIGGLELSKSVPQTVMNDQ